MPVFPQTLLSDTGHRLCGSGVPSLTKLHEPALPGTLHDWHRPQDAELQQTPSTQVPAAQGCAPHGSPMPPPLTQ